MIMCGGVVSASWSHCHLLDPQRSRTTSTAFADFKRCSEQHYEKVSITLLYERTFMLLDLP